MQQLDKLTTSVHKSGLYQRNSECEILVLAEPSETFFFFKLYIITSRVQTHQKGLAGIFATMREPLLFFLD